MKRGLFATILWTSVAACIGVFLFFVKHEVKDQERRLTALNSQIQSNQETIHILRAEWSYLNDPTRLRALAEKHLGMHPVKANEVATLDSVLRNGLPSTMLAAATPPRPVLAPPNAKPVEPLHKQPVKLADGPSRQKPSSEAAKPTPKPQPSKPGSVTMAKTETPPPTAAPAPATGGRAIIIKSPSLAQQNDGGGR
ncbi:hypothetical protein A6A04_05770 [Paramagnetospirillum marisnigri]|uniref:Uncharacterized protein n=1 Tax=Paramagnetospirillum marisnigri TaxID=1285242 RepID=A0A178MCX9_9PROT|nr:hypothetical protein [Paramagnetospirillum marisnigri]OAN46619.1 hypothetical protein A6A04_05770 [Paramagnetospirillum marisnigri]